MHRLQLPIRIGPVVSPTEFLNRNDGGDGGGVDMCPAVDPARELQGAPAIARIRSGMEVLFYI